MLQQIEIKLGKSIIYLNFPRNAVKFIFVIEIKAPRALLERRIRIRNTRDSFRLRVRAHTNSAKIVFTKILRRERQQCRVFFPRVYTMSMVDFYS